MKGIIKKFAIKDCKTKDGKEFSVLDYEVDVIMNDKGEVRTRKGSMSSEYARKYFEFCNTTTKEQIGKECDVTLAKRQYESKGVTKIVEYIKFLNLLDKDGNKMIMLKEKAKSNIDF